MGLDVYLYRYENFDSTIERESRFEKFVEDIWEESGPYEEITEERKNEIRLLIKDYARKLRLDEDGEDSENKKEIELPSNLYPDHYFKIGYFRSSYNSSGINSVLRNYGLKTLGGLFNNHNDEYNQLPDWNSALDNVNECIEQLKNVYPCRVDKIILRNDIVDNERSAMELFMDEKQKNQDINREFNYSNKQGEFFFAQPLEVLAFIPGKSNLFNQEVVYVINKSNNDYYIQALEIVRETIKYVLEQGDINKYYLKWSG